MCPDIFERVATEASKLAAYNKKSTISSREIQTSLVLNRLHLYFWLIKDQCPAYPARRAREARRLRRDQGRHQVLLIDQVGALFFTFVFST